MSEDTSRSGRGKAPCTPSYEWISGKRIDYKSKSKEHSVAIPTDFKENAEAIETQLALTGAGRFARIAHAFRQDPRLWFGVVLFLFVIAAIFAPIISPYSPLLHHPSITGLGPSLAHLLGTDALGRDQLSRVIYGTRISLSVAIATILMGGVLGTLLGVIGAYLKGWG